MGKLWIMAPAVCSNLVSTSSTRAVLVQYPPLISEGHTIYSQLLATVQSA